MFEKFKKKFLNKQFLTFGLIGAFNTIGAQVIYIIFVYFNVIPSVSSLLGDGITMVFSYFLNMRFTYHEKCTWKNAVTFPLSYIPGMIINAVIVTVAVNIFGAPKTIAKLISLPITVPLNFVCMSLIVKLTHKDEKQKDNETA